jgi:hypothetical protein
MIDKIFDKKGNEYSVLCTYKYNNKSFVIYTDYKVIDNAIDIKYGELINNDIMPISNTDEIEVAKYIIEKLK